MSTEERDAVRALYAACARALTGLGLPRRFALEELIAALEGARGRPLRLMARDLPSLGPHGLWVAAETTDYIVYDTHAGRVRRHQIIGHELGHLFFDDEAEDGLRRRTSYERAAERRAEIFGSVVLERVHGWDAAAGSGDEELLGRLSAMLEGGTPWR
jgi:Zn-dependent peptidase ImmA (M78 family)